MIMVLNRIIEQVSKDCRCKNDNSVYLGFLITSSYPYLYIVSGLYLSNHFKYFNVTLKDCELFKAECLMLEWQLCLTSFF